jgi:hypothetical protein
MVAGIWVAGPFFMTLGNTFTEGSSIADAWKSLGSATLLFPVYTFIMAAYDASLYAVLFTTMGLLAFAFSNWSFGRFKLG